jgi:hypothetical protein
MFTHAAERLDLDRAESLEVDVRHARQRAARAICPRRRRERFLHIRLDVVLADAALEAAARHARKVHAELTRETAHRGARMRGADVGQRRGLGHGRGWNRHAHRCIGIWRGGGGRRCRRSCCCGSRRGCATAADSRDDVACIDTRALADLELDDRARGGRRHVHRRLFRLERDERRLERDGVALLH